MHILTERVLAVDTQNRNHDEKSSKQWQAKSGCDVLRRTLGEKFTEFRRCRVPHVQSVEAPNGLHCGPFLVQNS